LVSLGAAWITCRLIPAPASTPTTIVDPDLKNNYRILRRVIRRINRVPERTDEPDRELLLTRLDMGERETGFLRAAIHLEKARGLSERDIPARMPGLLKGISSRDPYLWREKNRLIYRWLDRTRQFAKMDARCHVHPPASTAMRLRILKARVVSRGAGAAAPLLHELFPRVSLGRILDGLSRKQKSEIRSLLRSGDWEARFTYLAGRSHWSRLIREIRECPHKDLNEYFRAANAYRQRRYSRCRRHLDRINDSHFKARADALRIKIDLRAGQTAGIWERIGKLRSERATHIRLLEDCAGLLLVKNHLDQAIRGYKELTKATSPRDTLHWKAIWVSAWIEMKRDQRRAARKLFLRGSRSPEPGYQVASAFWQQRLGGGRSPMLSEAPFTYYFVRYSGQHRQGLHKGLRAFSKRLESPVSSTTRLMLEKALGLMEIDLEGEARRYLEWARDTVDPKSSDAVLLTLTLALMESHRGRHYNAFVAYRRGMPDYHALRPPRFLRQIPTPLEFTSIIARYSGERDLDPNLVAALIREESMFRPDSRSSANAYGLMQMLPRTYAQLSAQRLNSRRRWELVVPENNIRWGTLYLRRLLDKYNGRIYLALAAYNAGDHRVDRWLRLFGDVPEERFIEMIPFSETRNYVKNIMRNRFYYAFYHSGSFRMPGDRDS